MKKSKKKKERVQLEYLARSPKGLWVKGIRDEVAIEIFWKPVFQYEKSVVTVLDFNGDVEKTIPAGEIEWGEEWRSLGRIELVDEMVVMSGLEHFEEFAFGLMRQGVRLLTCGYGEVPEDVLAWFSDFGERNFVVEDEYQVIRSHGEFQELEGCRIRVSRADDGSLTGKLAVGDAEFEFNLNDSDVFTSFVIATVPV